MEDYFYYSIPETTRGFYAQGDNLSLYQKANPDVFAAMQSLARILEIDVLQTVTVNAITEYSTYCTSIVARDLYN